jgi:hypothetical protein
MKSLRCIGTLARLKCRLDGKDFTPLPADNVKFDLTTINNLSKVKSDYKKGVYSVEITADDESKVICNEEFGKFGLELRCKALGGRTADFPEIWETVIELDEMYEVSGKDAEVAYGIFNQVLEQSFPDIKDKVDYLKIFVIPKLDKYGAGAVTKAWIEEEDDGRYRVYPLVIGFSESDIDGLSEDKIVRDTFTLDLIHELSHVARELEGRYKIDVGEEEGENYTEALVRGDWVIRSKYPLPHGEVEEVIYAKKCILPKWYCFESLRDARDFEEFNYELVTGEEKPKPVTPESPDWDEIEERIPVAPIVDMLRGMKGSYNVLTDVKEYWLEVTSPTGKKYLYHVADLHVDHKELSFAKVLEMVDELDSVKNNEDVEAVWDYP